MRPRSLEGRLTMVVVLLTVLVAVVAGTWSYRQASGHARELQDDVLLQVASLAASAGPGRLSTDSEALSSATADIDVATLAASGLDPATPPGLITVTVAGTGRRAAVARVEAGESVVASQPVAARDRIARDAALSAVLPLLVLLPLLALAIVVAVRRVLAPIGELADEVTARAASDLRPVDGQRAPDELRGFVTALNEQVARAGAAVAHERRFVSQAAHELRTPLTAMAVQLDRVGTAPDEARRSERLADLRTGMRRSRHVVDQLLDLARAQVDDGSRPVAERFDAVLRTVVADVLPAADACDVEIVVESGADEVAAVPAAAATSCLRNLLDNAVRYGAAGGIVVLAARRAGPEVVVTVDDGGPGMSDPEGFRQPFVRGASDTEGSGLGLAIVTEQAARVGGSVAFERTDRFPSGTRAVLRLPLV